MRLRSMRLPFEGAAFLILSVLTLLTFASGVRAQFICSVRVPTQEGTIEHQFVSLSCSANNCTASLLSFDTASKRVRMIFERSTDGGQSWVVQDPGLPDELAMNQNAISVVEQIDSLNVVGIGDSGLIVRTFDGGATWHKQQCPLECLLKDVSFSDPMNGVLVGADIQPAVFLTADGGVHWTTAPFGRPYLWQCHAYGNNTYRAFVYGRGKLYSTSDGWVTVDSTKEIFDSITDPLSQKALGYCNFTGGDTILAYGNDVPSTGQPIALIVRSTDAGKHWTQVADTDALMSTVRCMSKLDRDTVVAGCGKALNRILLSTDRGATWRIDTLFLLSGLDQVYAARGIALSPAGNLIVAYGASVGGIVTGVRAAARVSELQPVRVQTQLYPNPATTHLTISSIDQSRPVHIIDVLGREVLRGELDSRGQATFDVSSLPRGIYAVMLDHFGRLLPVGKVAVVAKE